MILQFKWLSEEGQNVNDIEFAREFAIRAHGPQKYGNHPYVYHLEKVAELAKPYGEMAQVVAYLHDICEDTPFRFAEVQRLFGQHIAKLVSLVTDGSGASREERKRHKNQELAKSGPDFDTALIVKVADRLANVRECQKTANSKLSMYAKEHADFRKAAYRPGLCDENWKELDDLLAQGAA